MKMLKLILTVIFCWTVIAFGQTSSTEARLIRLEEGQKSLDKRFDETRSEQIESKSGNLDIRLFP